MKFLYIALVNLKTKEYLGIKKKIEGQLVGLRENGISIDLLYLDGNKVYLGNKIVSDARNYIEVYQKLIASNLFSDYDGFYIRHNPPFSPFSFKFIKKLKRMNRNKHVLLEIPTFPYYSEFKNEKSLKMKAYLLLDRLYFSKLIKKYVDKVITFNYPEGRVFNIDTINLVNGIDPTQIDLVKKKVFNGKVNLLSVSTMLHWHGIDRILIGLKNYYSNKETYMNDIRLHLVGEGKEKEKFVKYINENKLEKYVVFHGSKTTNDLQKIYNECDIAISSLGLHRIEKGDPLKTKEYLAAGLPVVIEDYYSYYPRDTDFIMLIPPDETPLDICKVLEFLDKKKTNSLVIRKFAMNEYTWSSQMKEVLKRLN
ncbi:glycosyltransferase [Gottfriedia acidiceleris]|uniref:glycosyltransferase n=1 Tax=Gottfriedia acidiceleris TaxID=371036 RepID=UPI003D20143E